MQECLQPVEKESLSEITAPSPTPAPLRWEGAKVTIAPGGELRLPLIVDMDQHTSPVHYPSTSYIICYRRLVCSGGRFLHLIYHLLLYRYSHVPPQIPLNFLCSRSLARKALEWARITFQQCKMLCLLYVTSRLCSYNDTLIFLVQCLLS